MIMYIYIYSIQYVFFIHYFYILDISNIHVLRRVSKIQQRAEDFLNSYLPDSTPGQKDLQFLCDFIPWSSVPGFIIDHINVFSSMVVIIVWRGRSLNSPDALAYGNESDQAHVLDQILLVYSSTV